jgi:hypothetical protein
MAHQVLKHLKSLYIDESGCISGIKEYPQQLSIVSRHSIDYNPDDTKASTVRGARSLFNYLVPMLQDKRAGEEKEEGGRIVR